MRGTADSTTSLRELGALFLRLGVTGFGGPAAHIAMMRDEVVVRRAWMTEEQFLDLLGATNLIPGPNSTEMAIHIGWVRRRWAGLAVAGVAFISPAVLITAGFAAAYVKYGTLPHATWLLWGVKPIVVAIVAHALWMLLPKAARSWRLRILAVAAVVATAVGVHELIVLFAAGVLAAAFAAGTRRAAALCLPLGSLSTASSALSAATASGLFWVFLKIGSVLFGSGYVLIAFLRADLVERLGWMTETQLLDAVAVGQVTPGPVFSTATFIGYLLSGPGGALLATVGIFLPAFLLVALSGPLVPRIRSWPAAGAFLDGITVASVALMAVVTVHIGRAALVDALTVILFGAGLIALLRFRINATWLIGAGALAGLIKSFTA
ncbi:MAG: chromate efflux transporter [Planctomycetes bacterium]|nr:chromate efflux transporter [Planctomycetota bacterium]